MNAQIKMKLSVSFLYFVLIIGSIDATRLRRQIVGGVTADIKNYPYQVSIRYESKHRCGGAIISDKHVLTAAHCIGGGFKPPFGHGFVCAGTSSSTKCIKANYFSEVTIHPGWKPENQQQFAANDIAIIKLTSQIRFDANQQKINLPTGSIVSGSKGIATGWGHTSFTGGKTSEELQMLEMTLLSRAACEPRYKKSISYRTMNDKQFCTYHSRGHGTYMGDSGGPIVQNHKVIGIVSYTATGEAADGSVGIVTDVFAYKDFITQTLSK